MSLYEERTNTTSNSSEARYKGVRRRQWGKWVSEIRVPGTGDRLWLGSYATPKAAAVAHDAAVFFLRGPARIGELNFPDRAGRFVWESLSPRTVQKVASDFGMAADAEIVTGRSEMLQQQPPPPPEGRVEIDGAEMVCGDISVDDMDICAMALHCAFMEKNKKV